MLSEPLCTNTAWAEKQLNWSSLNANGRQRLVSVTDIKKNCYTKPHALGDNEQGQPKSKEIKSLKISINIPIMGITERYSVKYSTHSIIDNTVLKIQLLNTGLKLKTKLCFKQFLSSYHNYFKFINCSYYQHN